MELFRRALAEHDDAAWSAVYAVYSGLIRHWIGALRLADPGVVDADDLVNATFERLWHAVDGPKFACFPSLSALLQYLKMCTRCAAITHQRAQAARAAEVTASEREEALQDVAAEGDVQTEVHLAMSRSELWATLQTLLDDPLDLLVLRLSFVEGLSPRQIVALRATQFGSVADVYRRKRIVLERLRRHPALSSFDTGGSS
jgi:RNA polymerase sigma factor (sigma-70 family)